MEEVRSVLKRGWKLLRLSCLVAGQKASRKIDGVVILVADYFDPVMELHLLPAHRRACRTAQTSLMSLEPSTCDTWLI